MLNRLNDRYEILMGNMHHLRLSEKVAAYLIKKLMQSIYVPEGDFLDKRVMKVSKVAHKAHNNEAVFKRFEAIRLGVEQMKKMKERMDREREAELAQLNLRLKQQQILAMNDEIKPALKANYASNQQTPKVRPGEPIVLTLPKIAGAGDKGEAGRQTEQI